jgi:hypothetical protein
MVRSREFVRNQVQRQCRNSLIGHARQKREGIFALDVPGIHVLLPLPRAWMAMTGKRVPYGVMETGEKSTNQLFGCTKPLTFGLIARGATSWAT